MSIAVKTAVGPTILLAGGSYFDFSDPHGSNFSIDDIAQGLAHGCRFAGQCDRFYSVAEHCVLVADLLGDTDPVTAYAGLMHDAAEAFIGDMTRPLKAMLPEYKRLERQIEEAIFERFSVPMDSDTAAIVKRADLRALAVEQSVLMPAHDDSWVCLEGIDVPRIGPIGLSPAAAKAEFLRRYAGFRL